MAAHDISSLPTSWKIERARHVFDFGKGLAITKDDLQDEGIPCVSYGEVHSRYGFEVDPRIHELKCVDPSFVKGGANALLRKGDFVFADTSEDVEGSGNFTHLTSDEMTFAGYHTIIARGKVPFHSRFMAYLLDSLTFRAQVRTEVTGVKVFSITQSILKDTCVWLPPISDQMAIASLLDEKCQKIGEAVRVEEEQIALLRERRKILTQDAVLRGLKPEASMVDSGLTWIGKIPSHWTLKRAKYLFKEIDERSVNGSEELLSVSHITGVTSRSEKNVNMFMAADYTGSKLCQPGDVVINTMWAWMGALGVSGLSGIISPSYGVYRALDVGRFNGRYLEYVLKSDAYVEHYTRISTGLHSSRLRLYPPMFLGMLIAFPPRDEQDDIVAYVEAEGGKIDNAISIKEAQISALKEYKASLTDAAVTGKIKVA